MAQLELSVVLNLANFRTQLGKLAQASAAYYYPINLTIDKQAFKKQLVALGNIKTQFNINDSQLVAARARIGTLNKSLATLRRAASIPIEIKVKYKEEGRPAAGTGAVGRAITGRAAGEEVLANKSRGELQKLYGLFREANLRVGELSKGLAKSSAEEIRQSLVPAFSDSGEEAVNGLAIGLKDPSSKVSKAAERLAKGTIQDTKKAFGIASPSRVFKEIGKDIVDGLELGLQDFNALRTKIVGEMRQLISAIKREAKVGGITMGGLLSPIARPTGTSTRTLPGVVSPSRRGESADPGRGNQKILNSLSLLTGNPALYRGRMANLGAERLPSSLLGAAQSQFQLEELAPSFKQARLASGVSPVDKIIDEAFFGRGTLPKAQSALSTLSNSLERLGSTARAALPSGILQSASGNARMRRLGGVAPGESMGIFEPTARPAAYPPSGGFLEFSRRATAISSGLPGNVFGGRGRGDAEYPSSPVQSGQSSRLASPLGAGYFAVGKGLKDIESAYGQAKNFLNTKNLPITGAIADLGSEFGNAIKQVLLFGTAYKALAFLTSLPGEAFEAAKGLATYRNQLQAVTAESGTFEQSFAFVDGLATRFNVPLESARQGFVKLYASMQPAGFDQGQIENLFTGISKAAAAFGLSSDKVDRVNYAFAQMASKGQIMSEELKGQLGDVLPGALGLFAKAAQMSIPEFSKAMEDGAFKGKAMEQVLGNVATLLNDKFGTAAEGAAKTLQGAVNQIQNNLALMYQSFSPIVDGVAAAFGPQVNALIKDVTDTVKVLTGTFTQAGEGFNSLSPRAQGFYVAIQTLEPSLRQAGAAIADLGGRLARLAPLFIEVLATAISFASSPLARAALLAAVAIGTLTAALKVLEVTGLKAALKSVYSFISSLMVGIPQATGVARVALISLKIAVTGLFIGAVLVGLDFLIGKILDIGGAAQKSINDVKQLAMDLDRLAGAQDTIGLAVKRQEAENKVIIAERLLQTYQKLDRGAKLSDKERQFLREYGTKNPLQSGTQFAESQLGSALTQRGMAQKSLETANRLAEDERRRRAAQTPTLTKVDLSGGDGAGGARGTKTKLDTYDRSTLDFIKLRLEAEKQSLDRRRQAGLLSETAYKIAVAELELESSKEEVAEKLRLSRLAINKDNLSAADKVLKLKDMEILAERELSIATDKRNIAIEGARKELSGPFDSAIKDANFSMVEQRMLLENLQSGIEGLTAKQQAYLKVLEMTRDLSEDEFDILKDRIKLTSGAIEKEILSKQGVQQGTILNELGGQLRLAQTLDPRVELRETLRQRNPLFSNAQIEQQAVLSEQVAAAQKAKDDLKGIASAISNAFGEAFKGIVTGSMTAREALTGFFQGVADSFADMVANMIAEYLKMALIKGIMSLIPGLGSFAGGANIGQSVAMPSSAGVGAGGGILQNSMGQGFGTLGPNFGIRQFANGGVVTGPTLGLVGEGKYNEAVIPLPDGRSVPVQLSGGDGGNQVNTNITVNVSNGQAQSNATGSNSSELGRKLEGAVKQVIVGELRPGGLLASR